MTPPPADTAPELPPPLAGVLAAVRAAVARTGWSTATDGQIAADLGRRPAFDELRTLVALGHLKAVPRTNATTDRPFLVWMPRPEVRPAHPCDLATVRRVIADMIAAARGGNPFAIYRFVRGRFVWFDRDGTDIFRGVAETLVAEGVCRFETHRARDGKEYERFDLAERFAPDPSPQREPLPDVAADPTDADFEVLNALEDEEAARINFGGYETALAAAFLAAKLDRSEAEIRASLAVLGAHHYLLALGRGTVRSRMAELARAVRFVKQRFRVGDADDRPFLIRAIQVRTLNRNKPARDAELLPVVARLTATTATIPHAAAVLAAVEPMLRAVWHVAPDRPVCLAGFQERGLERLLPAYFGLAADDAFAVTADTGAGKTEAAVLPLIVGAATDRLSGRAGAKAVFVYPRVRLACNQAQRLVGYLAALAARPGMPLLTLGVQTKDVPKTLNPAYLAKAGELAKLWPATPDGGGHQFPLFACPEAACGGPLRLDWRGGGDGADRLTCEACGWRYGGWVGTKEAMQRRPPDFFLPVTESVHQWLHDPDAGRLFGDDPAVPGPRAVLADEIHLYSHVHGAQVGFALRRLLARCELNARQNRNDTRRPLAIGMSATLGKPALVWGQLTGRAAVAEITPTAGERRPNPRGREYFYFVQPEIESRGVPVAGESATIQTLMVLAHGMRRRPGDRGGYRGLVFFDSIDSLKRLLDDYRDAEEGGGGHPPLAALRTRQFPPHPITGRPRRSCCRAPAACDLFDRGECWFFAAESGDGPNDRCQVAASAGGRPVGYRPGQPLRVMPRPVYSGTGGRVDRMMRGNDLVFATSSLEVGFDDPEMILVYQHYAPANPASFVQRKGRGGRGADDRPVTGVTLSLYSPRDSWYFRHPDQMLGTGGFEVPLNAENFFVRRGQAVAALLDALARHCVRTGTDFPAAGVADLPRMTAMLAAASADATRLLDLALGAGWESGLGVRHVGHLWARANAERRAGVAAVADKVVRPNRRWRKFLPWVPQRLFDAINLPQLVVRFDPDDGRADEATEDVSLAFGQCAPGHATRRYGERSAHWLVPPNPAAHARMLPDAAFESVRTEPLLSAEQVRDAGNTDAGIDALIRDGLPADVPGRLRAGLLPLEMVRPVELTLERLGRFTDGGWAANWYWDAAARELRRGDPNAPPAGCVPVHHRSGGRLLGFPLLRATEAMADVRRTGGLARLAGHLRFFTGGPTAAADTGLRVARAFWGGEVSLRLDDADGGEVSWSFAFTDRTGTRPQLYGYTIDAEGVQLAPDPAALDEFLDGAAAELERDGPRARWLHGQFFRYLLVARIQAAGLTGYAAGPVADLIVAASGPAFRPRLAALVDDFDPAEFSALLTDVHSAALACHPLLTPTRLTDYLAAAATPAFGAFLETAVAEVRDAGPFRDYLRSLVLHGLLLELHALFVIHGRGDERQVLGHARLPVQFPGVRDTTLSVFESGDHGDGTTRTFRDHLGAALGEWLRGGLGDCPYAAEDALLDQLFENEARHAGWRTLDPRDPDTMPRIARELTGTDAVAPVHRQLLGRVLFQEESAGHRRFAVYALHREIRAVRDHLTQTLNRRPSAWELVSEAVRRAESADPTTVALAELHAAYRQLATAGPKELGARARLADQVYRLAASVCVDGCRGCLHRASPLMPDAQAAVAVSRDLLARYREFVLAPATTVAAGAEAGNAIAAALAATGFRRLLVDPAANDAHAPALVAGGFTGGVFDPLLRRVAWVRGT